MNVDIFMYDKNHRPSGCITPSVINQFKSYYDDLVRAFEGRGLDDILSALGESVRISEEKNSPCFLSALKKLISRNDSFLCDSDFSEKILSVYGELISYCGSDSVKDELFLDFVEIFESRGFEYKGTAVQGVGMDECAFDYSGVTVGIKLGEADSMMCMYADGCEKNAVVYIAGDRYFICETGSVERLADAARGCILDFKDDGKVNGSQQNSGGNREIAQKILSAVMNFLSECQ